MRLADFASPLASTKRAINPADIVLEGPIKKRGGGWRQLKQRYFVLAGNRIEYLTSKDGSKHGEVLLAATSVVEAVGKKGFNVKSQGGRMFECEADDKATRDAWVAAIAACIDAEIAAAGPDGAAKP